MLILWIFMVFFFEYVGNSCRFMRSLWDLCGFLAVSQRKYAASSMNYQDFVVIYEILCWFVMTYEVLSWVMLFLWKILGWSLLLLYRFIKIFCWLLLKLSWFHEGLWGAVMISVDFMQLLCWCMLFFSWCLVIWLRFNLGFRV